jgi:actin-related protein
MVKQAFTTQKLREEVPIIISGGTSLPKGFIDLFKEELNAIKLPFKVSEVRQAKSPLSSVATGCLIWANSLEID